jgi:hypothetical protein
VEHYGLEVVDPSVDDRRRAEDAVPAVDVNGLA